MYSGLNLSSILQGSNPALVELLQTSTHHGMQMLRQRLEAIDAQQPRIPLAMGETLQGVIQAIKAIAPDSVQVHFNGPTDNSDLVAANPSQIHQVFMNLCLKRLRCHGRRRYP
ncbi:MAG: hypothetical protein HC825_11865, partial [Oscillatoriales cyanobacterium RM1_1_9]|nr:hypothetical protein [Oscillatoriales cyanobacterium RM1_1_9]